VTMTQAERNERRCWERANGGALPRSYLPAGPILRMFRAHFTTSLPDDNGLRGTFLRARDTGRLTIGAADELCVRLFNMHPCEVYGEAWWTA